MIHCSKDKLPVCDHWKNLTYSQTCTSTFLDQEPTLQTQLIALAWCVRGLGMGEGNVGMALVYQQTITHTYQ